MTRVEIDEHIAVLYKAVVDMTAKGVRDKELSEAERAEVLRLTYAGLQLLGGFLGNIADMTDAMVGSRSMPGIEPLGPRSKD